MSRWRPSARAALAAAAITLGAAAGAALAQPGTQPNPFIPQRSLVTFYGTGSAQFTPLIKAGAMATPAPTCMPKATQVGFKIECQSSSTEKTLSTCRGSLDFYAFNVSRIVSGTISGTADTSFTMTVSSSDAAINGCMLGNQPPAAMG